MGRTSRQSRASPRQTASCTRSSKPSGKSTVCSAASARRGWSSPSINSCATTPTRPKPKFGVAWMATCVVARATRTSSNRCFPLAVNCAARSHYALTGICAVVTLRGGTIASARIGVTGVGPKAYRPTAVEQALVGKSLDEEGLKAAVQTVADGIDVQGDIHASPEYRAHLARVLTRRAVLQAAERAKG